MGYAEVMLNLIFIWDDILFTPIYCNMNSLAENIWIPGFFGFIQDQEIANDSKNMAAANAFQSGNVSSNQNQ